MLSFSMAARVTLLASVLASVLAGACGDEKLAKLEAIRDEVCACKTAACGEAAMQKVPQQDIESNRKSQRLARDMLDCLAKLYAEGAPATDPDAPAAADPAPGSAAPATP